MQQKRHAQLGSWTTPPTPMHRKWEVKDAKHFLQRLSLDEPISPKLSSAASANLSLQTTLDDWVASKEKPSSFLPIKYDISPSHTKVAGFSARTVGASASKTQQPLVSIPRRVVGFASCGETDSHKDPTNQSPERCTRISAILKALEERKDLKHDLVNLSESSKRPAEDSELLKVHTKSYLNKLNRITAEYSNPSSSRSGCASTKDLNRAINTRAVEEFDSIYMTTASVEAARFSAGVAIDCVNAVCDGTVDAAAAAIRPPGHHAESHCAMGFCFFNNAALAAKTALERGISRVLIVDQDIHHGNGTQRAFWDDERVMYFSVHRWDKGRFYPHNQTDSAPTCVGPLDSPAAGKTMNVAFCDGEMGDLEYRAVWESILIPVVKEFNPELVILSAGFDAAEGDPVGNYHVSTKCYGSMVFFLTAALPSTSKVVMLLEGGYNTSVTAEAFCECIQALRVSHEEGLDRYKWPNETSWAKVKEQAIVAINATIQAQRPYWKSLKEVRMNDENGGQSVAPCC